MENELLFIFKSHHKSNASFKAHRHTYHELIYFLKGNGTTKIGDTAFNYRAHDICFTERKTDRSQKSEKRSEYICLGFESNRALPIKSGVYSCEKDASILTAFLDILEEFTQKMPVHKQICNLKVSEVLLKISRLEGNAPNEKTIQMLINEIEQNNIYNISVKELAKRSSYSYDYFRHEFKRQTGMSPVSYIMQKRIERAKELLVHDSYSCTLISQICGFSTPAQFSAIFKHATGLTPTEYKIKQTASR